MFLLIQFQSEHSLHSVFPLHSTMFLLILELGTFIVSNISDFTFHYVSINTLYRFFSFRFLTSLHSTMFLLILFKESKMVDEELTLHSTMFLLILTSGRAGTKSSYALHSTMFLLIQSLTMFLTKQLLNFTFHYVSINTAKKN